MLVLFKGSLSKFDGRWLKLGLHILGMMRRQTEDLRLIFHALIDFEVKRVNVVITFFRGLDEIGAVHFVSQVTSHHMIFVILVYVPELGFGVSSCFLEVLVWTAFHSLTLNLIFERIKLSGGF